MAVREAHPQPFALAAAAMATSHVGRRPGLVDEHQPLGIEVELAIEPGLALRQNVRTVLLAGVAALYGMARPFSPASDMMPVLEKEGADRCLL